MGLDIAFSRDKAVAAGMELSIGRNGTQQDVDEARARGDHDQASWLEHTCEVVHVPGTTLLVENGGLGEDIIVRANKWGRVYEPLTQWLAKHHIQWRED